MTSGKRKHRPTSDFQSLMLIQKDVKAVEADISAVEQIFFNKHIFDGVAQASQTFNPYDIRYYHAAEFQQIIDRCAKYRVEIFGIEVVTTTEMPVDVCSFANAGDPIARTCPWRERLRTQPDLLYSATYATRSSDKLEEVE